MEALKLDLNLTKLKLMPKYILGKMIKGKANNKDWVILKFNKCIDANINELKYIKYNIFFSKKLKILLKFLNTKNPAIGKRKNKIYLKLWDELKQINSKEKLKNKYEVLLNFNTDRKRNSSIIGEIMKIKKKFSVTFEFISTLKLTVRLKNAIKYVKVNVKKK